jgi:hypothetical protein
MWDKWRGRPEKQSPGRGKISILNKTKKIDFLVSASFKVWG